MTASSLKRHLEHFLAAGVRLYEQTAADAVLLKPLPILTKTDSLEKRGRLCSSFLQNKGS